MTWRQTIDVVLSVIDRSPPAGEHTRESGLRAVTSQVRLLRRQRSGR